MTSRLHALASGLPAAYRTILVAAAAVTVATRADPARATDPAPPDTSNWKCQQCPFYQGSSGTVAAGVLYASGANASYGRYTGLDHSGAYADAAASGQWRDGSGHYAQYQLDNLGLPYRGGYLEGGREGLYDLQLDYQGQPLRLYDTTATPFRGAGTPTLTLPQGWVTANSTRAMTQLESSLEGIDLGNNRSTVSLLAQLFAGSHWSVYTDLSHEEENGTGMTGASFLTQAMQLPTPIDYQTNTVEGGANWAGRSASVHVAYMTSWFQDDNPSLTWQNPYLPLTVGQTLGRMALPPSSLMQQGAASGQLQLPVFTATSLSYSASLGRLSQDEAFLPTSTLPGAVVPSPGALDGDELLSHYALALASRIGARLFLRGSAHYDGRDEHTTPLTIAQTITDQLPGGIVTTPLYGEDRTRLEGSADYRLWQWLKVGAAGDYLHTHFSPGQQVEHTDDKRAWGYITATPLSALSFSFKGGDATRTASSFNLAALPPGENPLLRAYNYAPRTQDFFTLSASWSVTPTLAWSLQSTWTDDDYPLSALGLSGGRDRELSTTLSWAPVQDVSLYVDANYQRLTALQSGTIANDAPFWQVQDAQYFWSAGAGGQWTIRNRWHMSLDYQHARTRGNDQITVSGAPEVFPQINSDLNSVAINATYDWTSSLKLRLRYAYESFNSNDWALDQVYQNTVPNLLTLGEQPYLHYVNLVGLRVLYLFGADRATAAR